MDARPPLRYASAPLDAYAYVQHVTNLSLIAASACATLALDAVHWTRARRWRRALWRGGFAAGGLAVAGYAFAHLRPLAGFLAAHNATVRHAETRRVLADVEEENT